MRRLVPFLLLLVSMSCSNGTSSISERAHSIEAQVWSPYCPGRLLIDCTTTQARELRTEIRGRVSGGQTTSDVIRWVRGEFGDEAIARPDASGAGLVIWLVPVAIFLAGAVIVARVIRPRTNVRGPVT